MRRREFITVLGSAAASWPLATRAQQTSMPVIGFLSSLGAADRGLLTAFRQGVREAGYVEGQNVAIEYRWAQDQYDRLPDLAADLTRRQVTVIAAHDTASAIVAKAATTTIPIVFASGGDPVKLGLVSSLNRPGGNATGVNNFMSELVAKRLGLLRDLLPTAARFGALVNPNEATAEAFTKDFVAAAATLNVQVEIAHARDSREIEAAFATLARNKTDALMVGPTRCSPAVTWKSSRWRRVMLFPQSTRCARMWNTGAL
jgi:ABC-type uncharacterized transport system substrate-binding protein